MSISWRAALFALVTLPFLVGSARGEAEGPKIRSWLDSGSPESHVDVLFVGDGYQRRHLSRSGKYWRDVNRYAKRFFEERPFAWCRKRCNVRALFVESKDAGCKGSSKVDDPDTALKSAFSGTRSLRFGDPAALHRLVEGAGPTDIVFVMVNTERYGGGGTTLRSMPSRGRPLPAPTFSAQDTTSFLVAVHELGHSFARLADEYVEAGKDDRYPLPEGDRDLGYPNVTLASHIDRSSFESVAQSAKWKRFLALRGSKRWTWSYEGGYYRDRGVFRPFPRCMMNKLGDPFCPVCCEALARAVYETCGAAWDEAAYQKAHPLSLWR